MSNNTIPNCLQCQKAIPKCIKNVKIAGCPHCGCVSMMDTGGFWQKYKTFTPATELRAQKGYQMYSNGKKKPFSIGKDLRFDGKLYTVYAIYVYWVQYQEYDTEDGVWQKDAGFVTEWYARNAEKKDVCLMRDTDEKFYIVDKMPKNWVSDSQFQDDSKEFGSFELTSFSGTDDEGLDERGHYIANNFLFESATMPFTKENYKGFNLTLLTASDIKRMQSNASNVQIRAEEDYENATFYFNLFGAALLAVLGLMLFANTSNWNRNDISNDFTEEIGKGNAVGFEYKLDEKWQFDTGLVQTRCAGTFKLKAGKNYLFKAHGEIYESQDKDVDFSVSIIKKDSKETVSEVDIGFFTESGTDDEGRWTENLLDDEFKFQAAESGVYDVFVSPDYEDIANTPRCSLTISVTETDYYFFYLWASGAFFLALIICQWQREHWAAVANLPFRTILHDWVNL
jgi:hypothetical protein